MRVTDGLLPELLTIVAVTSDDQLAVERGGARMSRICPFGEGVQADPAEVLLDALDRDDLDARVAEGLPRIPLALRFEIYGICPL
jgi:hypothetical protein